MTNEFILKYGAAILFLNSEHIIQFDKRQSQIDGNSYLKNCVGTYLVTISVATSSIFLFVVSIIETFSS